MVFFSWLHWCCCGPCLWGGQGAQAVHPTACFAVCVQGLESLALARRYGITMCYGSDLLGDLHPVQLKEVTLRSQMGFAISFLEEVWSRNLGHLFVSPLRPWELVAGLAAMSVLRTAIGVGAAMVLAFVLYGFGVWTMGPVLVASNETASGPVGISPEPLTPMVRSGFQLAS